MFVQKSNFLILYTPLNKVDADGTGSNYSSYRDITIIEQLMNKAEHLMKNYGDRGGYYLSRP